MADEMIRGWAECMCHAAGWKRDVFVWLRRPSNESRGCAEGAGGPMNCVEGGASRRLAGGRAHVFQEEQVR